MWEAGPTALLVFTAKASGDANESESERVPVAEVGDAHGQYVARPPLMS